MIRKYLFIKKLSRKAYLQIDFLFVILCFLLLFSFTYTQYSERYNQYSLFLLEKEKRVELSFICDMLVSSSGAPPNWEQSSLSNVTFFGLKEVNSSYVDVDKLSIFFNESNYLDIYNFYNFSELLYFTLKTPSGIILKTTGVFSENLGSQTTEFCFTSNDSTLLLLEVGLWE